MQSRLLDLQPIKSEQRHRGEHVEPAEHHRDRLGDDGDAEFERLELQRQYTTYYPTAENPSSPNAAGIIASGPTDVSGVLQSMGQALSATQSVDTPPSAHDRKIKSAKDLSAGKGYVNKFFVSEQPGTCCPPRP